MLIPNEEAIVAYGTVHRFQTWQQVKAGVPSPASSSVMLLSPNVRAGRRRAGRMMRMRSIGDTDGSVQEGLFAGVELAPEPVLMALNAEYYELIWRGEKIHEFRKRFLKGTPVRWFVYLNAPVSRLAAVMDLGPAVVDAPERIAEIAERTRKGNGASVLDYVRDLEEAFAIPILAVREYAGLSIADLRAELGGFHPPQGYLRLNNHPELLALAEKMVTDAPIREMTVHHR